MNNSLKKFIGFEKEEIEGSILNRFEFIANQYAERLAIKTSSHKLTYKDLNIAANQVAHAILHKCGKGSEPIAVLFEHEASLIIALLGILKAGKAYVVLDSSQPFARLTYILKDLETCLIITNHENCSLACELAQNQYQLLNIDELSSISCDENLGLSISSDSLAGIFYTSGSTGNPKGVERDHRMVLHRTWIETNDYKICADDKISLLYSCSFGASVVDIFNALLNGATLCLYDLKKVGLNSLTDWLLEEEITFLHLPVIVFQQWLDTLTGETKIPKLRQITPSGKLYKRDLERFRKHFPQGCTLIQRLSSTEAGMIRRFIIDQQTEITNNVVPVGYPVEEQEVFLLNEAGEKVGCNQIGEIAVKSRYLAPGYWRNPELTRQKFLSSPDGDATRVYHTGDLGRLQPDGCLEFLGRKDFMVKIRGYRVELSEIEAALFELDTIKQAVVVAQNDQSSEPCLVAYIVPSHQSAPNVSTLRRALANKLPDYMIPSFVVVLDQLPLTPNGKVDRLRLPPVNKTRPELNTPLMTPQNELEQELIKIWEGILGVQPVGTCDNFFDLGGNSLLGMQLFKEIEQKLGKNLPLTTLFQAATVTELAHILSQENALTSWSSLVTIQPNGSKPPVFFIGAMGYDVMIYRELAISLDDDQPIYALRSVGPGWRMPTTSHRIQEIATHFIAQIRTIQPNGPYFLGGHSGGGIAAWEMAQQLVAQGERVALLALFDTGGPEHPKLLPPIPRFFSVLNWVVWDVVGQFIYFLRKIVIDSQKLGIKQTWLLVIQWWQTVRLFVQELVGFLEKWLNSLLIFMLQKSSQPDYAHLLAYELYRSTLSQSSSPQKTQADMEKQMQLQLASDPHRKRYVPQVYPGRVVLFCATDYSPIVDGSTKGWDDLALGGIEVHQIRGNHTSIMYSPLLAQKFKVCLNKVQARFNYV
jgi:amino acid adenylation domain-containing protein